MIKSTLLALEDFGVKALREGRLSLEEFDNLQKLIEQVRDIVKEKDRKLRLIKRPHLKVIK